MVHEWFYNYTGSERVVEQILALFPQADLFALFDFLRSDERAFLQDKTALTSFIQDLPFVRRDHRWYLPLMPLAVGRHDVSDYDLVLSSSHAVSKGVSTEPHQLHISYVHTPLRYAWDLRDTYFPGIRGALAAPLLAYLRWWDRRVTEHVDVLLANSENVRRRIRRCYGREAEVVYPPVRVSAFRPRAEREDFYLTVSRLAPYKRIDLIVDAFSQLGYPLVVIGEGQDRLKIEPRAGGNVQLLGYQPDPVVRDHMERCKAFVFAADEDFGIAPVEAQAAGAPVIAYRKGGALETVIEGRTGMFFDEQSVQSLSESVRQFETTAPKFDLDALTENAGRFSIERFRRKYGEVVDRAWRAWKARPRDLVSNVIPGR